MKIVTANRLSDGRVIYAGVDNQPVETIDQASVLDEAAADIVLAEVAGRPAVFVNPYLVEVQGHTDRRSATASPEVSADVSL